MQFLGQRCRYRIDYPLAQNNFAAGYQLTFNLRGPHSTISHLEISQRTGRRVFHYLSPPHGRLEPSKTPNHNHNMLGFAQPTVYEASKCFFSYGRLSHLDPQQLPTAWEAKGKPWSSVLVDGYVSRVRVSLLVQSTHDNTHAAVPTLTRRQG